MSFLDRVTSLFNSGESSTNAPDAPAEPPHALRQHFAVSTREVHGFEVYSVAPMKFAETSAADVTHYDPHAEALDELAPADSATKAVLYLLPGGFAKPIQQRNWDFIGQLAEAGLRVDIPLYGLIPEYNAADGLPLIRAVYEQLIAEHGAEHVTIIGDSAGGSLALGIFAPDCEPLFAQNSPGTTPSTSDTPLAAPAALILNAPWADLAMRNPRIAEFLDSDPLLNPESLIPQGEMWARGLSDTGVVKDPGSATSHPTVSPLFLPDATLATTFRSTNVHIFCGTRDISLADAELLASKMKEQGVETTLHTQPGAIHMFHLTKSREGRAARKKMISIALNTAAPRD
ncbi:alpha/beta hydrolase fold domain-containing protein [Corynebacterium sp. 4HC-13]|uniref:alpha/beta hydrolase fold domain-containing protein n=1 Tax=Corynebacterium anserum TaxID=2684406 RepID=UPI00163B10DF|nr:alpha/beta hydrolase [Corynebacterium anserum]MBC2681401.1 alpha/beta hydrolase fold domain-containing protein [Corynebacterium anserum]